MAWIYLMIASFGEIFGVMGINLYLKKRSFGWLVFLIVVFGGGFFFLALALKDIPLGTGYAVWTGLGAVGAVLIGILFFKESADVKRIFFLVCIIAGAVGLKVLD